MRITRDRTSSASRARGADSPTRPRQLLGAGLLLLAFCLGFLVAWQGWHQAVIDGLTRFARQPGAAVAALIRPPDLPTLTVDLAFRDYDRLLASRAQALRLGVHVPTGEEPVPATIRHAGSTVEVGLRLPPGPAQLFEGEAWPLAVIVPDDGALFGLRRFLLRPADEDALLTLGYLEALRQHDHLVPRAQVVRLVLNGRDHGRYLLLEQPAAELLLAHNRQGSVLVTFDPGAYWAAAARLGDALPGSGFQYAQVAPVPMADAPDAILSPETSVALDLLQALADGTVAPADALDVERTASLLATTALWRGAPALDWRGLTFAYDPADGRLEPVVPVGPGAPLAPLPDLVLDDPTLQMVLIRTLETLGQPGALSQLQADMMPQMEAFQMALDTTVSPWESVADHQTVIRRRIAPSPILFATLYPAQSGLTVRLDNIQPFPVAIVGLDLGEYLFLRIDPDWVIDPAEAPLVGSSSSVVMRAAVDSMPRTVHLQVPPEALPTGAPPGGQVEVVARFLGLEAQHVVVATPRLEPEGEAP